MAFFGPPSTDDRNGSISSVQMYTPSIARDTSSQTLLDVPSSLVLTETHSHSPGATTISATAIDPGAQAVGDNPSTHETEYIYDQLKPNTIRILELYSPDPSQPHELHGHLITKELSNQPSYEALSYTWGTPNFDDSIHLRTGRLGITPNLAAALRQLRHPDRSRRLWIDAICVNQACVSERSSQVALMAQIYENSKWALAWLGEGTSETEAAMTALNSVAILLRDRGIDLEHQVHPSDELYELYERISALGDWWDCENQTNLEKFFAQDCFQRLWIVQEAALPCRVTLMNGSSTLEFTSFTLAIIALMYLFDNVLFKGTDIYFSKNLSADIQTAWELALMRVKTQQKDDEDMYEPSELLELVVLNASKKCADPRDLIFGILGLQKDKTIFFEANYSLDIKRIYRDFALEFLKRDNIRPLYYAGKLSNESEWPTWVPHWSYNKERRDARVGHCRSGKTFATCTDITPSLDLKDSEFGIIGVAGRYIDVVEFELSSMIWDRQTV
jgi:hypothetical protein